MDLNAILGVSFALLTSLAPSGHGVSGSPREAQFVLRFDGLYQSEKHPEGHYSYIRFYSDGTVITVSTTGTPEQVIRWFDRKDPTTSRGTYAITGKRIVFCSECSYGKVDYDANLKGADIELCWYSHINKRRGEAKYAFVKVEEKKEK